MERRPGTAPKHRAVRPRYGRICTAVTSLGITTVAVLGATGVLPDGAEQHPAAAAPLTTTTPITPASPDRSPSNADRDPLPSSRPEATEDSPTRREMSSGALPEESGSGRRVVFDMSAQRVWLVRAPRRVERTYLVSGSLTDNLKPGSYEVYSTSRHAVGIDESGRMQYMVRFARGDHAAIGFHDIPVDDGELVQTRAELGTAQSHGCIRQWRPDARALWHFAKVGTSVVVVA